LIDGERERSPAVWVNTPDPDTDRNPADHSDHEHVARAVLEATDDLACLNKTFYVDYASARLRENIDTSAREIKAATFAAVALGLNAMDHSSGWDLQHRALLSRYYFRDVRGVGDCG
jgi:hypothetical protein